MLSVRARSIVLDGEAILSLIKLVSPFEHVSDEGRINHPAYIDILIASSMDSKNSIVHSHRRTTLSSLSADSVSNHEISSIDRLDSVLASKTILKQLHLFAICAKRQKIVVFSWSSREAKHSNFFFLVVR